MALKNSIFCSKFRWIYSQDPLFPVSFQIMKIAPSSAYGPAYFFANESHYYIGPSVLQPISSSIDQEREREAMEFIEKFQIKPIWINCTLVPEADDCQNRSTLFEHLISELSHQHQKILIVNLLFVLVLMGLLVVLIVGRLYLFWKEHPTSNTDGSARTDNHHRIVS